MHLFLLLLITLKTVSSQVIIEDELNDGRNITVTNCSPKNTDWLVWHAPLANFHKHRELDSPDCFDWTSDGCTSSPNHLFGFNFEDACQRHDFAYRNLGKQARLTSHTRQDADKNFLNDLKMSHLFLRSAAIWKSRQGNVRIRGCDDGVCCYCWVGDLLDDDAASQECSQGQALWDGSQQYGVDSCIQRASEKP
ncbi:hypothetical protein Vi05172_g10175 [Venturia inaequalis]|nr:hypothetical protein Vi05172_g10175 [Venturia inaequalis]